MDETPGEEPNSGHLRGEEVLEREVEEVSLEPGEEIEEMESKRPETENIPDPDQPISGRKDEGLYYKIIDENDVTLGSYPSNEYADIVFGDTNFLYTETTETDEGTEIDILEGHAGVVNLWEDDNRVYVSYELDDDLILPNRPTVQVPEGSNTEDLELLVRTALSKGDIAVISTHPEELEQVAEELENVDSGLGREAEYGGEISPDYERGEYEEPTELPDIEHEEFDDEEKRRFYRRMDDTEHHSHSGL